MGNSLQELTIKNHFMFAAVMIEGDNCKELLEMVLGIKIAKITVLWRKRFRNLRSTEKISKIRRNQFGRQRR